MPRRRLAVLPAFLAGLLLASPAGAIPPERQVDMRFDPNVTEQDEFLTETCGFPVFATAKGHFRGTVFFNRDGSFKRFTGHPSIRQTLTSPFGSLSTSDVGVDKISENPDGTLSIFGTGIHLKVKGEVRSVGLWRLVVDPVTEELLSAEYHGHFDLKADEIDAYFCSRLGPG